ncbi:MAG: hypothetical protein HYX83_04090 [Chloroflexi bacterium]|nr:hypothetical protein [Chloroflexota bacterium]
MPKKTVLVCDRCGFELTEKADVAMALEGTDGWQSAVRDRGETPRGVYPCRNYIRCRGEMQIVKR